MATSIHLPKVGMTMEEGTLTKWVVADGASVKRGDVIFEMETEKVQMEIEADTDGALKHLVAEGSVLHPGEVVGAVLAPGEEVPQALLDQVAVQSGAAPAGSQATAAALEATLPMTETSGQRVTPESAPANDGPVRASPIARRLADENGIDVRTLTGSGPDGRIVERDVQRLIEAKTAGATSAGASPAPTTPETPSPSTGRGFPES